MRIPRNPVAVYAEDTFIMSLSGQPGGKTKVYDEAKPEYLPVFSIPFFCVETEDVI